MFGKNKDACPTGMCPVCWIVLGILVLLNDIYGVLTWASFVGVIFILLGVKKYSMCKK